MHAAGIRGVARLIKMHSHVARAQAMTAVIARAVINLRSEICTLSAGGRGGGGVEETQVKE